MIMNFNNSRIYSVGIMTIGIVVGAVLLVSLILYLVVSKSRFKKATVSLSKKIEKSFKDDEAEFNQMTDLIKKSKKYNGSFKSLSKKAKKSLSKYLKKWIKEVPDYITLLMKTTDNKLMRLHIVVSQSYDSDKYLSNWVYSAKKSANANLKNLIKLMNKYRVTYALLDTVSQIYNEQKSKAEVLLKRKKERPDQITHEQDLESNGYSTSELYASKENDFYVKYTISSKKNGK